MKPLDGDPRKLQNPAQSAKGEERGDRERNPWLAKMIDNICCKVLLNLSIIPRTRTAVDKVLCSTWLFLKECKLVRMDSNSLAWLV